MSEGAYAKLQSAEALEAALRQIGAERYHWHHPFHKLLHAGELDKGQVQAWALNRYYYQSRIPMKDAALLARVSDPELRRSWAQRIVDHDGTREGQGGIAAWMRLCTDLGLDADYVRSEAGIHPGTRFAVDAYVDFVASRPLLEAIASSLTEMFAPTIIKDRVAGMLKGYSFISKDTLSYFEARLYQAPRDADFALAYVKRHADTAEKREAVCNALIFKCNVLWVQLDALHYGYVLGGALPLDAFQPAAAAEAAA